MIGIDVAVGIILRKCPLDGGSVILLCLVHALGVNMGWLARGRGRKGQLLHQVRSRIRDVSGWLALGRGF